MTDLSEVILPHLKGAKTSGSDQLLSICPFHRKSDGREESNPSFAISRTTGLYICFSCGERGNLYTFLKDVGLKTREQIELLYRPTLDELSRGSAFSKPAPEFQVVTKEPLPESLLGLFELCPTDLLREGFDETLLATYDVGFDTKHMRITYPLRDLRGQLVGISGRTVTDANPRYKVYDKEYEDFGLPYRRTNKGALLWNAHRVYAGTYFGQSQKVILVEGFKACLWLIQHGYKDTVALMGTHLSLAQRWVLEHFGGEVYVMLDNNERGRFGASRCAEALAKSLPVKVVEYNPEKQQPSDLTEEEIHSAIACAKDYFLWATEERNQWLSVRTKQI